MEISQNDIQTFQRDPPTANPHQQTYKVTEGTS